ncbi:hypothetical protein F4677DRAFT_295794 [Hypoxylon crocopeplum]|nr:hypothetical protein F4677DRAFT_295794 [Hypoxylon crocopeplum]
MKLIRILLGALTLVNYAQAVGTRDTVQDARRPARRDAIDESKWATEEIPVERDPELAKYFEQVDSTPEGWEARPINF